MNTNANHKSQSLGSRGFMELEATVRQTAGAASAGLRGVKLLLAALCGLALTAGTAMADPIFQVVIPTVSFYAQVKQDAAFQAFQCFGGRLSGLLDAADFAAGSARITLRSERVVARNGANQPDGSYYPDCDFVVTFNAVLTRAGAKPSFRQVGGVNVTATYRYGAGGKVVQVQHFSPNADFVFDAAWGAGGSGRARIVDPFGPHNGYVDFNGSLIRLLQVR